MNLRFFGGANEVGASSTLIEIDGYRILVDAGIRMNHEYRDDSPLPDFSMFDRYGIPDVVLLTHAHTDHTGALPDLHKMLPPDVKMYCTPATKAIAEVLLKDSVKIMLHKEKEKGEPARYTLEEVEAVLGRMEPRSDPVEICPGVTARWIRAGHILGAAMIYIEGRYKSILITGDVSVSRQLTIPSVDVPTRCKPDVMVIESTYGNRRHEVSRTEEAKRLVNDIANTIKEGGTVLLPAFAVGRSQEVILILKQAMERKEIPEFPVYVDGMVRDINGIYSQFADELQRPLRRKAEQGESLFYFDMIKKVPRDTKPASILAEGPCCIVASSGMLVGGKSAAYAKYLVRNPRNLIAITGYQTEGTPGRALDDLRVQKDSENRIWFLDNERFDVKCRVERYSLSAHADSKELLELVKKGQPRKLFLVHGDAEARKELSKSVRKACPTVDVKLPKNGRAYTVRKRIGIARGRKLNSDRILREVAAYVRKIERKGLFSIQELAEIWFGTEGITPLAIKFFGLCLSWCPLFFIPDLEFSDLFRLKQPI